MKKAFTIFKNSVLEKLEYRGEIISGVIISLAGLLLQLFLWNKIMLENGEVSGYDYNKIVVYYLMVSAWESVNLAGRKLAKSFMRDVNSGGFSSILMKPIKPQVFYISTALGFQFVRSIIEFTLFGLPILININWRNVLDLSFANISLLSLYVIFITLFSLAFYSCVAYIIFWLESGNGFRNIVSQILRIVKGNLFPLDIAPIWFQSILRNLPFMYMGFYPAKILLGDVTFIDGVKGLVILFIYTIIFSLFAKLLFRSGIKIYDSVGN